MEKYRVETLQLDTAGRRSRQGGGYYNMFFIVRGQCIFKWGDERHVCGVDDIVLMKPDESMTLEHTGGRAAEITWVRVTASMLRRLSDEKNDLEKSFNVVPFRCAAIHAGSTSALLMKNFAGRLKAGAADSEEFAEDIFPSGLLSLLVVPVLRSGMRAEFRTKDTLRTHFMVDEVFVYLRAHFAEEVTLETLSRHFYVSREHIAREFKRQSGQSVHAYLVKMRIDSACDQLNAGQKVEEAARVAGFQSYSAFLQAFQKQMGCTPTGYRKLRKT